VVSVEWAQPPGQLSVGLDRIPGDVRVQRVEVLIDNEVVASATEAPSTFRLDGLPEGDHFVRVRVVYQGGRGEVVVESPSHHNPWWPYGGPLQ
jgi:hypothetical protein